MTRAVAVFVFLVLCQAAILTVGALALRISLANDVALLDLALLLVSGVQLPLLLFMLQRGRGRVVSAALAVCFALLVNVSFVSTSAPAAAVTDNSSVFTFARTTGYSSPMLDMAQNYSPSGMQAFCPTKYGSGGGGYNWTCRFVSDQFSAGQTLPAGNSTVDLYLENDDPPATFVAASSFGAASASSIAVDKPSGVASGDFLVASIAIRGGTGNGTITAPAGWNLIDRTDSGTSITLAVYRLIAGPSEPASYTWSWSSGSQKSAGAIQAFRGVDTAAPVDVHAGQSESTPSSSHIAPSVTATYGNEMRIVVFADSSNFSCNSLMDFQLDAVATSTGGGAGSSDATINTAHGFRFLPPGQTGTVTGSCGNNDIGATEQIALRSAAGAARTCTLTARVKLLTTIEYRSTSTVLVNGGTSISASAPAGVVPGDVLIASVVKSGSESLIAPSAWTYINSVSDASTMYFATYWHVAASGDPASWSWTWSGAASRYGAAGVSAYRNVDNDTPVDVKASVGVNNTTSFTAPTVTTTFADEMIITTHGVNADNSGWTPPAGMNERLDLVAGTGTTFVSIEQNDVFQAGPPAATGAKTATANATGGGGGITFALKPGATLGSGAAQITSPVAATLASTTFATTAVSFATGDRLSVEIIAPNDSANCATWLSYDGGSQPSKLTVATAVVPEALGGLLLLAPALPLVWRWRKRTEP